MWDLHVTCHEVYSAFSIITGQGKGLSSLAADTEGTGGGQGQLMSDLPIDSVDALHLGGKEEQKVELAQCLQEGHAISIR